MRVLITGAAGFIGAALAEELLKQSDVVLGIDNLNDYYDPQLKMDRNTRLEAYDNYTFLKMDIQNESLCEVVSRFKPDVFVNLAAQAGVRYSIENPRAYLRSNVDGFFNVLEACRINSIPKLVYASSSSVYGDNNDVPFHENARVDDPVSFYAATKICNEIFAKSYKNIYGMNAIGLRFFTVYGPWGRPDMAVFKFTKKILEGSPIELYNSGKNKRDFTFINDIVEGVVRVIKLEGKEDVYNIGNKKSVEVLQFVKILEDVIGKPAITKLVAQARGDVFQTFASTRALEEDFGYETSTNLREGLEAFFKWYSDYEKTG